MNYEKAYKESLERAKKVHKYSSDIAEIKRMEDIFPELKESEDERIRKEIIKFLIDVNNGAYTKSEIEIASWIAWLEKQGQVKENTNSLTCKIIKALETCVKYAERELGLDAIDNVDIEEIYYWLEKQGEKKPKWTDEDEKRLQSCISTLQGKGLMGGVDTINTKWLKSLKQRIKQ